MAKKYLFYRAGNSIFCDNLYDKIFFKRMDIYIGITESLCSTPETYNIVNQLYSKKFKKKITEEKTDLSWQVLMQMKVPYSGGFATKYMHW